MGNLRVELLKIGETLSVNCLIFTCMAIPSQASLSEEGVETRRAAPKVSAKVKG